MTVCTGENQKQPISHMWSWSFPCQRDERFALSAREWLDFQDFINEVRSYYDLSEWDFDMTGIERGQYFRAAHFTDARNAISEVPNHGAMPNTAGKDEYIYGQNHFQKIEDCINDAVEDAI